MPRDSTRAAGEKENAGPTNYGGTKEINDNSFTLAHQRNWRQSRSNVRVLGSVDNRKLPGKSRRSLVRSRDEIGVCLFWFLLKKYYESESESTSTNGRHTDSVPLPTKINRQEEQIHCEYICTIKHSPYETFKKARPSMTQDRFQFFTQLIAPFLHWHSLAV